MTRWLRAARSGPRCLDKIDNTDKNPVFASRGPVSAPESLETANKVNSVNFVSEGFSKTPADAEPNDQHAEGSNVVAMRGEYRHGTTFDGTPKTWTGKIVSLDQWRRLSEWEKHGPDGKHWNGKTHLWEMPE